MWRWLAVVLVLPLALRAAPAEPLLVEDFEGGVGAWQRVEGTPGTLVARATAETTAGAGALQVQWPALPQSWAHVQRAVRPGEWSGQGGVALRFRLRGDGSGERLNVMFGNYEARPALMFRASVLLDFTDEREITLPFDSFEPAGLTAALSNLVLLQFNVSQSARPVSLVIDEIAIVPGPQAPAVGDYHDYDLVPTGGWECPAPAGLRLDPLGGLLEPVTLPATIHGIANHRDLHNPLRFEATWPAAGSFGVLVGKTSGYGGSRLILKIDGREARRWDFPGTTETALTQYQGWYQVPVPAGSSSVQIDNDGQDWLAIERIRFGNLLGVGARIVRQGPALEVRFSQPEAAVGLQLNAALAGRELPLTAVAPGLLRAAFPTDVAGSGTWPVSVTAQRDGRTVLNQQLTVDLSGPRLRLQRIAWPTAEPVEAVVRYANRADVPLAGATLTGTWQGQPLTLTDRGEGLYGAKLGTLAAGVYDLPVQVAGGPARALRLVVYDPTATRPGSLVRLTPGGGFEDSAGRPAWPWGYATIGIFAPDAEFVERPAGPSNWTQADPAALRDWLALLRAYGVNVVRFGVNVDSRGVGGDQGGRANPAVLDRLAELLDILGTLNMRAIPVLWWGHYRNFSFQGIPAYDKLIGKQADWFTNAAALALQQQYVREVVSRFTGDPRVFAWEVMNETYRAGDDLPAAVRWTNAIVETIRAASPEHLITTSAAEATPGPEVAWMRGGTFDFFNWHAYPTYPDYGAWRRLVRPEQSREMGLYAAVMARLQRFGGRPSVLGEVGNDRLRELSYPEMRTLLTRDGLWLACCAGSPGGITWDAIADLREVDVISRLAAAVRWDQLPPDPAPLAVRLSDLEADLHDAVEYTAWSLRSGVPVDFLSSDEPKAADQSVLPTGFVTPNPAPKPLVAAAPGYEVAVRSAAGGRYVLAYLRNVAGALPQNVRLRTARAAWLRFAPPERGSLQVWDLDTRQPVQQATVDTPQNLSLGTTDHDFALLFQPAR
ncbi:MAG: cellulase family glycosylhydrolase [Fimbriimonadaceae bacterium]|nr:cellulase family glycosylhydrolase [Fimbriimonadaceae bacterium]